MSFMQVETVFDVFIRAEDKENNYETVLMPLDAIDKNMMKGLVNVQHTEAWFGRLTAPGFLDCTEWFGPYITEEELIDELDIQFDLMDDQIPAGYYRSQFGAIRAEEV